MNSMDNMNEEEADLYFYRKAMRQSLFAAVGIVVMLTLIFCFV